MVMYLIRRATLNRLNVCSEISWQFSLDVAVRLCVSVVGLYVMQVTCCGCCVVIRLIIVCLVFVCGGLRMIRLIDGFRCCSMWLIEFVRNCVFGMPLWVSVIVVCLFLMFAI